MGQVLVKKNLSSPWVPKHVTSSTDGAAIDISDLAAEGITLPVNMWWVMVWIYVVSMEIETGTLLSVTIGSNQPLEFKWTGNAATFVKGNQIAAEVGGRPNNQWFMVTMGCDYMSNTGGMVRTRVDSKAPKWGELTPLESPASVRAPVGAGNFDVIPI
jgi:hypothetical protein